MVRVGIVVPAFNQERFDKFISKWKWPTIDYNLTLYIIDDNPKKTLKLDKDLKEEIKVKHYSHKEIDKDLKDKSWIISRKSSSIRSYGYYCSWKDENDYTLTLDDDCYPSGTDHTIAGLISNHFRGLNQKGDYSTFHNVGRHLYEWSNIWMRGSPIRYRKKRTPQVSIGAWNHNPDLDAWTQLENQNPKLLCKTHSIIVQKNQGITLCGMNWMFHTSLTPITYFLLQGADWGIDRVDDIWAGLFMKKVMDKFDIPMCVNSYALVHHDRASNALASLKAEGISLMENELLWDRLLPLQLEGDDIKSAYISLIQQMKNDWFPDPYQEDYGATLRQAMMQWVKLYD